MQQGPLTQQRPRPWMQQLPSQSKHWCSLSHLSRCWLRPCLHPDARALSLSLPHLSSSFQILAFSVRLPKQLHSLAFQMLWFFLPPPRQQHCHNMSRHQCVLSFSSQTPVRSLSPSSSSSPSPRHRLSLPTSAVPVWALTIPIPCPNATVQ